MATLRGDGQCELEAYSFGEPLRKGGSMNAIRCCTLAFLASCVGPASAADEQPYWLKATQDVHAKFRGTPGYLAQFGDSITHSMAF
jgi:hypothetical protein